MLITLREREAVESDASGERDACVWENLSASAAGPAGKEEQPSVRAGDRDMLDLGYERCYDGNAR